MKFRFRRDLAMLLLALYLLFVGLVALASLGFERFSSQKLDADVKASDLALASTIAQETGTSIDKALYAVSQLAQYRAVVDADPAGMESIFQVLINSNPDINLIYRLDDQGIMVYHYPTGPGDTVGWDFSARDYFQSSLASQKPLFSQGRQSPTTGQPVATAVMPLWNADGKFLGVVATNLKLEALSYTLNQIASWHNPNEGFEVAIIDSAGMIIANQDPARLLSDSLDGLPGISQAVLAGQSGSQVWAEAGREDRLYSYIPIPNAGWGVIVSRSAQAAYSTRRSLQQGLLVIVGIFLVIGVFFWWILSRQVLAPLEQLDLFSQRIAANEAIPPSVKDQLVPLSNRLDQIGNLSRTLIRMQGAIDARLKELSTLLQTGVTVVSSLDSSTVLDRILEQVERLMGIRKCAIVALDEAQGLFRAKASRGLSQIYAEQLAIVPGEPASVTMRAIRTHEPVQVSDTETDTSFSALRLRARTEGYRSILAVPLNTQHAPPSALLVYRQDPHVFSQQEINLLSNFAVHTAMAIENALLYERSDARLQEQTRRLEALIQSMKDGLILEDLKGKVIYANRSISELVGLSLNEISEAHTGKLFERIVALAVDERKTRSAMETVIRGRGGRSVEVALLISEKVHHYELQVFDVTDAKEMLIGRGYILQDITQNRELDRMKSSLVSTVSHELRTPLAAIKGYATTLLADDVEWDLDTQHEFLEIISSETDRLTTLVSDLLDMSKLEAGNLDFTRVECDLANLIERAALRANPQPNGRLRLELSADVPVILADPQRLEAVLRNLIENAAKYAGDQSPIWVKSCVENHHLVVRIEDQGPGIPEQHRHLVFQSFYRADGELNRIHPGMGLGLAISQGFIRAHGGEIWLEPRPVGACVAFSIPL